ncbi:MAG: site-specific DNA-methyltransferase [Bacilli bacterium]
MTKSTTNLSKIRRDKMLDTISEIKKNITDEVILTNLSMVENELTKKKYGLIWEEHEERVDEELKTQIPTFEDVKSKSIIFNSDEKFNFLLEGDNLHSLYLLEKTHKEKIDVIYIDPPYNTGARDFMYNDIYVDSENEYKHSKWLSFMQKRLEIAKKILKENGIIFISIDNNEQAQLKLLCDDIFGELSFVTTLHIELSATQGMKVRAAKMGNIVKNAEYIHVYCKSGKKDIAKKILYDYRADYDEHYSKILNTDLSVSSLIDEFIKIYPKEKKQALAKLYNSSEGFQKFINENSNKIFRYDKTTGFKTSDYPLNKVVYVEKNKRSYYLQNKGNAVEQLMFLSDSFGQCDDFKSNFGLRKIRGDWWKDFYLDMGNVSKEGNMEFSNGKKPLRLIKQIIKMSTEENAIVLDFFAGSGTTGQAVLEQNKEDGGNRQFILCTNNENNICEDITYPRIINVIDGYGKNKPIATNLKYYKTSYIPRINTENENLHNNLLINIKNLIQLENGIEIDDKEIKVYLDEFELDSFALNQQELDECNKVYISSDILLTLKQQKIFENNNIEVFIIPEYYFEDEIMEVE